MNEIWTRKHKWRQHAVKLQIWTICVSISQCKPVHVVIKVMLFDHTLVLLLLQAAYSHQSLVSPHLLPSFQCSCIKKECKHCSCKKSANTRLLGLVNYSKRAKPDFPLPCTDPINSVLHGRSVLLTAEFVSVQQEHDCICGACSSLWCYL